MPGRQKVGEEGRMAVKLARHSVTTWVALIFVVLCNLFCYMAMKDVRIKGCLQLDEAHPARVASSGGDDGAPSLKILIIIYGWPLEGARHFLKSSIYFIKQIYLRRWPSRYSDTLNRSI